MIPPPPISTLFPYTTLFRSSGPHSTATARADDGCRGSPARGRRWSAAADAPTDRKSTRLNSSHVSISYAVFCLKKKKDRKIRCDILSYLHSNHIADRNLTLP